MAANSSWPESGFELELGRDEEGGVRLRLAVAPRAVWGAARRRAWRWVQRRTSRAADAVGEWFERSNRW